LFENEHFSDHRSPIKPEAAVVADEPPKKSTSDASGKIEIINVDQVIGPIKKEAVPEKITLKAEIETNLRAKGQVLDFSKALKKKAEAEAKLKEEKSNQKLKEKSAAKSPKHGLPG
jgi:hypothetical protein